jgi:hypothetical protein
MHSTYLGLKALGAQLVVWAWEGSHLSQQVLAAAAHAHHLDALRQGLSAALQCMCRGSCYACF